MSELVESVTPRGAMIVTVDEAAISLIDMALAEDRGAGDWTTRWTVPPRARVSGVIVAKADGVIAGWAVAEAVFHRVHSRVTLDALVGDGERVSPGQTIARLRGPARAVLTGERVALNFIQRLSGVATLTRRYVDAVQGTGARILDTRKTTPGWRALEKAAVRAGGGENHRAGLYDMVLIKENHAAIAGGITQAVERVREHNTRNLPITVEVHSLDELDEALRAGVDRLLLDNMDTATMTNIVQRVRKQRQRPQLEASGNMSLERVPEVARTGVDFISVGAITHSAPALDLSLLVDAA